MDKNLVDKMLYEYDEEETMQLIVECKDSETLHLYAYNYNWDDGFQEPTEMINNPVCCMSTALTLFYLADGVEYLSDPRQEVSEYQQDWWTFVTTLYDRIIKGDFPSVPIKFEPPITRVERYNMEKNLSDAEAVFYTPIKGVDCDIDV